jgi:membrane-bound metal-dependent hydrolase YbcI (DUF457 family)
MNPAIFLLVSLIATLIPDVDSKNSFIGKIKIFRPINLFTKHRGIFHSFLFLFFLCILFSLFAKEFLIAFAFGYALHLLLDSLTLQGIRFLYPFNLKIRGKIKTGGVFETILFFFSLALVFFILLYKLFSVF